MQTNLIAEQIKKQNKIVKDVTTLQKTVDLVMKTTIPKEIKKV